MDNDDRDEAVHDPETGPGVGPGVGPWIGAWPDDPRLDPDLLREGDHRNVADEYRYWTLEAIVDDLDAKLAILATPEAQDAKAWLGEYLAAMSDQRRARLLEQVPNRATMTSEQLRQEIDRIQRQRTELQQQQQAFATRRQDLVDAAAANRQQTADAAAAAAARRQMAGTYSPYRDNEPTVGSPPFSDLPERSGVGMVIGPFGPYITFGL